MEAKDTPSLGLQYSSTHLFDVHSQQGSKDSSGDSAVFDCGAVFDPFVRNDGSNVAEATRTPILCLHCAAYLSLYALVNNETGVWVCPLCRASNPRFNSTVFHTAQQQQQQSQGYGYGMYATMANQTMNHTLLSSSYAEFRASHCIFYEDVPSGSLSVGSSKSGKPAGAGAACLIFAVDTELCADAGVIEMICDGIVKVPHSTEVCVLLYGRQISALRMGAGHISSGNPLVADVVPGSVDKTHLYAHLISRGTYGVPAGVLRSHLDVLRQGLGTFAPDLQQTVSARRDRDTAHLISNQVECTVDALVAFAVALDSAHSGPASYTPAVTRLVLLTSRSMPCRGTSPSVSANKSVTKQLSTAASDQSEVLGAYSSLGAWAFSRGCSIDLFNASLRAANPDHMEALASPSGGFVVAGNSYSEPHIRTSFSSFLARHVCGTADQEEVEEVLHSPLPTMEIRTCGRVLVDRIVGPIVSTADVIQHTAGNNNKERKFVLGAPSDDGKLTYQEAELAVDQAHLAHSLYFLQQQQGDAVEKASPGGAFSLFGSQKSDSSGEKVYDALVKRNQQYVVLSGVNQRHLPGRPGAAITIQLKVNSESTAAGVVSPYKTGNVLIGKVAVDESAPLAMHSDQFAYVQIVARYRVRRTAQGSSRVQKVTRVWTQRLPITRDKEEYMRGLDASLWAVVAGRGLVADHHVSCMKAFGGAIRNQLDQEGRYAFSHLKATALRAVDELTAAVATEWPHLTTFSQDQVLRACRLLYHLREGPLLDGPAADHMESYLLRSVFLKADWKQSMRLLMPTLTIDSAQDPPEAAVGAQPVVSAHYPPPSSAPPSANPVYTPPAGPPPSLQTRYPPPSLPPPGPAAGAVPSAPTSATALFPPPPTPPPSAAGLRFPPPSTPPPQSNSSAVVASVGRRLSLSLAPDTIALLPGTVAVLDCGDRIIVRRNWFRSSSSSDSSTLPDEAAKKLAQNVAELLDGSINALVLRLEREAAAAAAERYPAARVHVLPLAGTPQDRMLYCRLAPVHTDPRSVDAILTSTSEVPFLLGVGIADVGGGAAYPLKEQLRNATWRAVVQGLSAQDLETVVAQLPYTDQPFFGKYLSTVAPAQAPQLLTKLALPVDNIQRGAPVALNMDRGPLTVFAPPTQHQYSPLRPSISDSMLPL